MKKLLVLFLILVMLLPSTALADEGEQRYTINAGSYSFALIIGSSALKTATDYPVIIRLNDAAQGNNRDVKITVLAEPVRGVSATPVKINVTPNSDGVSWDGKMSIPISGRWSVRLTAEYPGGKGNGLAIISVSPPPAIPDPVAWVIGLIPVMLFLAFVMAIGRWGLKKRKLEFEG
jgi:hypothetical protein